MSDRPSVVFDDTGLEIRASKLGACPRAIAAEALGYHTKGRPDLLIRTAKEGHLHEAAIINDLRADGANVSEQQGECVRDFLIDGINVRITGHYEGLVDDDLLEIKSMSADQFKKWVSSVKLGVPTFKYHYSYAWQISFYMACFPDTMNVRYVVKNRNDGEVHESRLTTPPFSVLDIQRRLETIVSHLHAGVESAPCDKEANAFFCSYYGILNCGNDPFSLSDVELVEDPELEEAIMFHCAAKTNESIARKDKDTWGKVIRTKVVRGKVVTPMGYTASITPTRVLDRDKLRAFLEQYGKTLDEFEKESARLDTKAP